jgi:MFS family permease
VLLGLTSLLTDISSEMVATVLPLYLVYSLGLTPLQFGMIDGLQQGAAALVRVTGGFVADRWRRHKEVAVVGYGLSAIAKLALLAVGSAWTALAGIVLLDRTGKGIRTGPRDALISLSTPHAQLGTAFGVHRSLDTTGAMLGPLIAFGLLMLAPLAFDAVFLVSFCFALVGLAILVLFVDKASSRRDETVEKKVSARAAAGLLGLVRFRMLMVVGSALGLMTMSDGFVYLALHRRLDFDLAYLPLLFVGTAAFYMLLAMPTGALADRIGRTRVFLGGYSLLLLVYVSLVLLPALGPAELLAYMLVLGAFYAATDGVLMALGSTLLPSELRASGLALLVTATSLARLAASVIFGALWTLLGLEAAIWSFAVGLVLALSVGLVIFGRWQERLAHG